MGVVSNAIMNESKATAYATAPVAPNFLNDALPAGDAFSMGVVKNAKTNGAQADANDAAPESEATTNAPASTAASNVPAESATVDAIAAADTSNTPAVETPQLRWCSAYSKQILMADKEFFW